MAYALVQVGTTLNAVQSDGTVTVLTLPTGVTLLSTRRPRFALLGSNAFLTNSTSRNLWIDQNRTVRPMNLQPPPHAPVLTAASGGTLSGTFKVKLTFLVKDTLTGDVLSESPFGPESQNSPTLATQWLVASGIPISPDSECNARRLYRTTTGPGTTFYPWLDLDGNTQTSIQDDLADSALSLVAAPTTLGNPSGTVGSSKLLLLASWRGRLWGQDSYLPDDVIYSEEGSFAQWAPTNRFTIPPKGFDSIGVTGFAVRKEALGVGKVNAFFQITGTSNDDFRVVKVTENSGVIAPESVVVYRDAAYFLWLDGVYQWNSEGLRNITDGKVRSWFTSSSYFNQSKFDDAFATIDPIRNKYRLHLAAAGSTSIDRWIEYDLEDGTWWGPHKRDDVTPSCAILLYDSSDIPIPVMGSTNGFLWKDQSTRTDGTSTGIAFSVDTKAHDMNSPDIQKFFDQMSLISKVQSAGTLTVTPYVGSLNASAGNAISADMTKGRERLRRLGTGRFAKLNFAHSTAGQDVELFGYEIPFSELGRR